MFNFSSIINAKVHDKDNELIGRLRDIVIDQKKGRKFPPVVGILVKCQDTKEEVFVSVDKIDTWSSESVVLRVFKNGFTSEMPSGDGAVFVSKNILDKQIVDLSGVRVVRVNDLQFSQVQGMVCLLAIDVSTSGLLRRLGLKPMFGLFKPHLLEWHNIHLIGDKLQLAMGRDELVRLHPADIANLVEKMNVKQGSQLLRSLDQATAARVMEEVSPHIQKMLVQHLGAERAATILEKMSMDELVDLIQLLPSRESQEIVEKLPPQKDVNRVKKILEYDEDTAGGLMTTEFISAHLDTPVSEVIEKIRRDSHQHRSIHFVYVIDDKKKYLGVASLRRLIVADPKQKIKEIMKRTKRTPVVNEGQSVREIANIITKYNLLSVAVIDKSNKLLGVVTVDDVMRHLVPNA